MDNRSPNRILELVVAWSAIAFAVFGTAAAIFRAAQH